MLYHRLCCIVLGVLLALSISDLTWARGFGGMHGGMRGGMHGGMGGGMRGGMGGGMRGGFHPQGGGFSQASGGMNRFGNANRGRGGFESQNRGAGRSGPSSFGANRQGGFSGQNEFRPSAGRSEFNAAGRRDVQPGGFNRDADRGADRFADRGLPGKTITNPYASGRRGANELDTRREGAGSQRLDGPGRGQLGNFLGLPSDGGLHGANGRRFDRDQRGLGRGQDVDRRRRADDVRQNFDHDGYRHGDFYAGGWYRRYPGAWHPAVWANGTVWSAATWSSLNSWIGYSNAAPQYYDYGNNVTYQDDSVYVNGNDVGSADEYYQQAQTIASDGSSDVSSDQQEWMPLGVFAMTNKKHTDSNLLLQLAVNKSGIIRGNYTATLTHDNKPVHGSVDKKTQRAAWTIGDNTENVIETGIYNLTKDDVPVLVHFGKDKTEHWELIRLDKGDSSQGGSSDAASQENSSDSSPN